MKIAFRATGGMASYRLSAHKVTEDGCVYTFAKDEAERLLKEFPLNWFTPEAVDEQLKTEAAATADADEAALTALPAGHPQGAGDTTGVDLKGLSDEDAALYKEAARKVDSNEDLTDAEAKVLAKVEEAANAS